MNRIGIIDNFNDIRGFAEDQFHEASAGQIMAATGGNTGNVAFVFGLRRLIKNPTVRVEWGWSPTFVRSQVDQLVVCCANQIGPHADLSPWADMLEAFDLPVTLVGLGAQAASYDTFPEIPEGTRRLLAVANKLRAHASNPNISVRGHFSRRTLSNIEIEACATGCPSLLISSQRKLGQALLDRQAETPASMVAVASGNPWHGPSAFLESRLTEVVNQFKGAYILQHPETMIQFALGETERLSPTSIQRFLDVYTSHHGLEDLLDWYRRHAHTFVDAPNWMQFLRKFDLVIGPRYHGVALGLQSGVPGCVFTIDSRTRELCEETAIKSIPIDKLKSASAQELVTLSRWTQQDAELFDANRELKVKTYQSFLRSNDIEPSDHLMKLAAPVITPAATAA